MRGKLVTAIRAGLFTLLGLVLLPGQLLAEVSSQGLLASEANHNDFSVQLEDAQPTALPEDLDVAFDDLQLGEAFSLDEVTRMAVARSLDINIFQADQKIKQEELPIAESVYDTELSIDAEYEIDESQPASSIAGTRSVTGGVSTTVEKLLPSGTELEFLHAASRDSTNSAFATLSRSYEGSAKLSVTQSLLENSFGLIDRSKIQLVELDVRRFDYETADRIESQVFAIRNAYWDLVFAHRDLAAKRRALEQAQEFLRTTNDKLILGLVERQDVYAAEANARLRVIDALTARTELENKHETVLVLLDLPRQLRVIPSTQPAFEEINLSVVDILKYAYQSRRDYRQLKLDLEIGDVKVRMKRSSLLPQLDVEASYRSHGLDRDLFDAQGEIGGFNHPSLFAGFTFNMPFENRKARAEYTQARLGRQRVLLKLKQLEREIERQVREAIREVELTASRVKQTEKAEVLQRNKLVEEAKAFQWGRSDSRTIIDFQEDLIEAEKQAQLALVDYSKAKDALLRTEHGLLEATGVIAQ